MKKTLKSGIICQKTKRYTIFLSYYIVSTWEVVITLVGGAKSQSAEDTTLKWYLRPKSSKPTFYKNERKIEESNFFYGL